MVSPRRRFARRHDPSTGAPARPLRRHPGPRSNASAHRSFDTPDKRTAPDAGPEPFAPTSKCPMRASLRQSPSVETVNSAENHTLVDISSAITLVCPKQCRRLRVLIPAFTTTNPRSPISNFWNRIYGRRARIPGGTRMKISRWLVAVAALFDARGGKRARDHARRGQHLRLSTRAGRLIKVDDRQRRDQRRNHHHLQLRRGRQSHPAGDHCQPLTIPPPPYRTRSSTSDCVERADHLRSPAQRQRSGRPSSCSFPPPRRRAHGTASIN